MFRPDEDRPGADRVVILMHAFWRARFGADPSILGRAILLNGNPYVVIGVMPDGFQPLSQPGSGFTINLLVPAAYSVEQLANRRASEISVVGRLMPNVSIEQAQAELDAISADFAHRLPATNHDITATVAPLRDVFVRNVRLSLIVMLWAVGLVLLIACVNLGNVTGQEGGKRSARARQRPVACRTSHPARLPAAHVQRQGLRGHPPDCRWLC